MLRWPTSRSIGSLRSMRPPSFPAMARSGTAPLPTLWQRLAGVGLNRQQPADETAQLVDVAALVHLDHVRVDRRHRVTEAPPHVVFGIQPEHPFGQLADEVDGS